MAKDKTHPEEPAKRARKTHQVTAPTVADYTDLLNAAKRQNAKPNTLAGQLWEWALPMFKAASFNVDELKRMFGEPVRQAMPSEPENRKKGTMGR